MPTEVAGVVDRVLLENSYKHVGLAVGVRCSEETFLAGRGRVGGTGGFRSVAGFVAELRTSVVVLSNSARAVDGLGLDILRRLGP